MSRVEVRDLCAPEAVVRHPLGDTNQVRLAQTVVSRHVLQPGWSCAGGAGFDPQPGQARALATILFTDIVDSTARASDAGDASWKGIVHMHNDVVRSVRPGFGGRSPRFSSRSVSASTAARSS